MIQIYTAFAPLLKRIKTLSKDKSLDEKLVVRNSIFEIEKEELVLTDSPTALKLLSERPELKVMALSDIPSFAEGQVLLQKGLKGYANTHIHLTHLKQAISLINSGNIWLYPTFMQELILQTTSKTDSRDELLKQLSLREQETALEVAKGKSNKEIATELNITERTVKAHLSSIFEKVGASDRFALALMLK